MQQIRQSQTCTADFAPVAIAYNTRLRLAASAIVHSLAGFLQSTAPPGLLAVPVLLHPHLCIWPIMYEYDVIHKTGSTKSATTPPEEDRATEMVTCTENLVKIGRVVPEICSRTDRQTWSSQCFAFLTGGEVL